MGTRISDGGSNRLWKDYTAGGATGKGTYAVGDEIMRLDAAMCSSRIVLTPINDFVTTGATATAQWSLDGAFWFPLPYSVQGGPKVATGVFPLGTRQALILPDLGNFFRVIANTAGAFADPTANNLVAGLTEDDGLQFSPDTSGGGGGGGGGGPVTAADGALVTIGTTTDAATGAGNNTTLVGALRAIRDKLLGSVAVTGTFFQATQPVSGTVGVNNFPAMQAVTTTDGAQVTLGTTTDAASASGANSTVIGALRAIRDKLLGTLTTVVAAVTTYTSRSGSITAGGTAQQLMPANAARRGYSFQNVSTADLYILENAATATSASATNASVKVPAGGYYYNDPGFVPQGILSVFGATTGQAWFSKEY